MHEGFADERNKSCGLAKRTHCLITIFGTQPRLERLMTVVSRSVDRTARCPAIAILAGVAWRFFSSAWLARGL
jgi:hypothetical protein